MGNDTISIDSADVNQYRSAAAEPGSGDLTPTLLETDWWTDQMVADAGIPVVDVPLVSIGGGVGSFVLADYLRIAGMPPERMRVLSVLDRPWQTYQYLTEVSQIPSGERLRSDSGSCPGNIWGFPAYSLREAATDKTLAPLFNVLTEPILTDYWTPKAGQVFDEMQREADRIGWWDLVTKGQVRLSRRRHGGGYFTVLTPPPGTSATKRVAYRSTWVHVAVGYPGLKFLPDLQRYREEHGDYQRVVNAYEPHEQVYQELRARPGVVVVRGGGIVASRVLQRLIDDRDHHGAQTQIIHLFRTYVTSSHGPSIFMRRKGADGWAYQGFNWPKGAWGGQIRERLAKLEGDDRKQLYQVMGGTNTPHRKLWVKQLERGRREGWYRTYVGEVRNVHPGADGQTVVTSIGAKDGSVLEVPANFVIDCTGLEADIREHRYLADLLDHSGAGRNVLGRLDVERNFEVRGVRADPGRMYASGSITLGGYYAGVDSFLGLQYAGLQIVDDLAAQGFCPRIGVGRSLSNWFKWMRNKPL
ncbi:MAG: hypothetical protein R2726_00840 [Acidimicrobiales bacterium]